MVAESRDETANAYDSAPWWYDLRGLFILTFAYNSTLMRQLRLFGRNVGPNHLEAACGTGTLLECVLRWRRWKHLPEQQIAAVDYAESMLTGAKRRFAKWSNIQLRQADVAALPYAAGVFDTANIANAIHCFSDIDGALRDVLRVLKPGGTLAATVLLYPRTPWPLNPIAHRLDNWGIRRGILVTPYQQDDIRQRIVDTGFQVISEDVYGNCYEVVVQKLTSPTLSSGSV